MLKVTSELLDEADNIVETLENGNVLSKFHFQYPSYMLKGPVDRKLQFDSDNDLDVDRDKKGILLIEHGLSTELEFVGLQPWRGAFLLADFILSNPKIFQDKIIIELGSGIGLTSIIAGVLASQIICTDIKQGGLLKLIQRNFVRNKSLIKSEYFIKELNFMNLNWLSDLEEKIRNVDIILAADVIYDDEITNGFVCTIKKILETGIQKTVFLALEKRYVFTIAELDTVAPMFEEFLRCIKKHSLEWKIEYIPINFSSYFDYKRTKDMTLMKISNISHM